MYKNPEYSYSELHYDMESREIQKKIFSINDHTLIFIIAKEPYLLYVHRMEFYEAQHTQYRKKTTKPSIPPPKQPQQTTDSAWMTK